MAERDKTMKRRRGMSTVYTCCAMVALLGMASLGVDLARVRLVKTELQNCADAAARAGVPGMHNGTWAARAAAVAQQNQADGTPVVLVTSGAETDVTIGNWNKETLVFTVGASPTNAVRVITRRNSDRGNAVQLAFAPLIGRETANVSARAVAYCAPSSYGLIGLDYVRLSGNATASYSSNGKGDSGKNGSVASNGPINLSGNSYIRGDARPGPGYTVNDPAKVSGSTKPLKQPLVFANGNPSPYGPANNSNANVPSNVMQGNSLSINGNKYIELPGGNYYFENISVGSNSTLSFTGPATVYAYGTVSITGGTSTFGSKAPNLKLVMVNGPTGTAPGWVSISSSTAIYASIYAPQSAITLGGSGAIHGAVLGKSIDLTGTSDIYYDLALDPQAEIIRLVQ